MLTRLQVRGFKTLADVDIELGQHVVFVGPNNSGKTSSLQALALWEGVTQSTGPLSAVAERAKRVDVMRSVIAELTGALGVLGEPSPWGPDLKVSDRFLTPLFAKYYAALGLPNMMAKTNFHVLALHVPLDEVAPEVLEKLDVIADVAQAAQPLPES